MEFFHAAWFFFLSCQPRLEGAVGGKDPSALLFYVSHFRLDSEVYDKQPRNGQQVCCSLFLRCVPFVFLLLLLLLLLLRVNQSLSHIYLAPVDIQGTPFVVIDIISL